MTAAFRGFVLYRVCSANTYLAGCHVIALGCILDGFMHLLLLKLDVCGNAYKKRVRLLQTAAMCTHHPSQVLARFGVGCVCVEGRGGGSMLRAYKPR